MINILFYLLGFNALLILSDKSCKWYLVNGSPVFIAAAEISVFSAVRCALIILLASDLSFNPPEVIKIPGANVVLTGGASRLINVFT